MILYCEILNFEKDAYTGVFGISEKVILAFG